MPVTIGQPTTEIVAQPEEPPAGAAAAPEARPEDIASARTRLAAIVRQALRTRAEGFDD